MSTWIQETGIEMGARFTMVFSRSKTGQPLMAPLLNKKTAHQVYRNDSETTKFEIISKPKNDKNWIKFTGWDSKTVKSPPRFNEGKPE